MRRSSALTVGAFSKFAVGEYSRRRNVGLSTWIRASADRTIAERFAMPSARSTCVARSTGEVSVVAAVAASPLAPTGPARHDTVTTAPREALSGAHPPPPRAHG